ncbi:NrdR family transcriptional regulator [Anoxybacteroides rupiense]|uniref:NrdR family transcriptional regulator n=1 Tax=Anoxybacteroides rupiense TaxID=311460 RepID=UPI0039648254
MNCPICGSKTKTLDVRHHSLRTRRRRECVECLTRFTTYEVADLESLPPYLRKVQNVREGKQ